MNKSVWKRLALSVLLGAGVGIGVALLGSSTLQAQMPSLPSLPSGFKIPGATSGKMSFGGIDALSAAQTLYAKDKTSFPTPNIAVSGNHVVVAWATGVVTIETISSDGNIHRTILGPPTDRNAP